MPLEEKSRYSEEEFKEIIYQCIKRQDERDDSYSEGDIIETSQQLGVDRDLAEDSIIDYSRPERKNGRFSVIKPVIKLGRTMGLFVGLLSTLVLGGPVFVASPIWVPSAIGVGIQEKINRKEYNENNHGQEIIGTVLNENYIPGREVVEEGANGKYTQTIDSEYRIRIRTDDRRELSVNVIGSKESLDFLVDEGSTISFPKGNISYDKDRPKFLWFVNDYYKSVQGETYFALKTQLGTKRAERIKVLSK